MSIALVKNWEKQSISKRSALFGRNFELAKKREKSFSLAGVGFRQAVILTASLLFLIGAVYLYQVNAIAAKGYEIKEIENTIKSLQKESQQLRIKEVELKSMYNIEKSMDDLNLVNSPNVSYLEFNSPMAMK
jgi:acylphosphatase